MNGPERDPVQSWLDYAEEHDENYESYEYYEDEEWYPPDEYTYADEIAGDYDGY